MKDWKDVVKYYSINLVFGNSLISYYNEKRDLIHCESGTEMDKEHFLTKNLSLLTGTTLFFEHRCYWQMVTHFHSSFDIIAIQTFKSFRSKHMVKSVCEFFAFA